MAFRDRIPVRAGGVGPLHVSSTHSLSQVRPDDWDRIAVRGGLYSSRPWLMALERQPGFDVSYLLAWMSGGRLVGALPVYRVDGSGSVSLYDHYALFVEPSSRDVDIRGSWFPTLYAGTKAGYRNEVLIDPQLDRIATQQVLRELVAHLCAMADESGARSLAWLYLTEEAAPIVQSLLGSTARPLLSAAATHMVTRWRNFDEYVASLPKRRRYSVRSEMERFASAGHRVTVGRLSDCYEEAGPLLANVQRKYGHASTAEEMTNQLARQAAALDEESVVFQCRHGSSLVAYALCFAWRDELYLRTVGFDYEATGGHAEYFSLGCYLPVRHAIENGLRMVHLGTGSYEAKLRRGAVPAPLWSILVPEHVEPGWERWQAGWNVTQLQRLQAQFGGLTDPLSTERWLGSETEGVLP